MSKTRACQLGAAVLAAAGVLSACSGGSGTNPSLAPSSAATSSSSSGSQLAPSVPSSLPTDALVANPCSALSADQVKTIGLTGAGTSEQANIGPTCTWKSATSDSNSISVSPLTANKNGLSDIYAGKAKDQYFEPTTVDGYPAAYADVLDSRSHGDCTLWVGVTDNLAVAVMAQIGSGPNKSNPCPVVERVATAMIQHLQGS